MPEYCIVFVDSDGWYFKEMEAVSSDLEAVTSEARTRLRQTGLPVLGVADRTRRALVYRTDGGDLAVPEKYVAPPTG